jgi:hypothetical protein
MKLLFLGAILMAMLFSCSGCAIFNVPQSHLPSAIVNSKPNNQVGTVTQLEKELADLMAQDAITHKEMVKVKAELSQAKTIKIQHELMIATGFLSLLAIGCVALMIYCPLFKKQAAKGIIVCVAAIGVCLLCVKLVPYRTWIEVGVALAAASYIAFTLIHNSHKTISLFDAELAKLKAIKV